MRRSGLDPEDIAIVVMGNVIQAGNRVCGSGAQVILAVALKPAFHPNGTITAGNALAQNSAAATMAVAGRAFAEARGLAPMVWLAGHGIAGVLPETSVATLLRR